MANAQGNGHSSLQSILDIWQERASASEADPEQDQAEPSRQMFLPGFDIGTMPNHLNRSSLFAPVARGRRKFHHQQVMVTRQDCRLEYTGEQLDEADADLLMALIYFAQPQDIGETVTINRAALLRKLGRGTGKSQYQWLERRMRALAEASLWLEAYKPDGSTRYKLGKAYAFRMLASLVWDVDNDTYTYALDPRWHALFGNREYAVLDWDTRLQIGRGRDMAKTLQRLVATTTDNPQRYALDRLKEQMQYGSPMRKFRAALMAAVAELERVGVIASGEISTSTKNKPQLVLYLPKASA